MRTTGRFGTIRGCIPNGDLIQDRSMTERYWEEKFRLGYRLWSRCPVASSGRSAHPDHYPASIHGHAAAESEEEYAKTHVSFEKRWRNGELPELFP